jgi:glycogen(starch) synthase
LGESLLDWFPSRDVATNVVRILFLSTEYPPETGGGGIGSYVANIGAALVGRGHEIHVLSCTHGQPTSDRLDGQVHIHRRGTVRLERLQRVLRSGKARLRLEVSLSCFLEHRRLGLDFDVVESPDWMAEGFVFALLRSKPHVGHLHTPLLVLARHNLLPPTWDRRLGDALERVSMHRADVVTSPSRMLARDLVADGWLREGVVRVVRLPVDLNRWSNLPPAEAASPRVVAVGRLEPRKAPEALVEAAAMLAPAIDGLEVVFVGGSNYTRDGKPYSDWTADLARKLASPVRFVDAAPGTEIPRWYGSARVAALTGRYDNFPVAGLEAMAAARPLVCTSSTGVAELIREGGGTVVPPGDPRALAGALRAYLIDADLAGRTGRAARDTVERNCSPEEIAREREACYLDAIDAWQRRRIGRGRRMTRARPAAR